MDTNIIGGIERHLPSVAEIMRYVEKKATGKVVSKLSQSGLNLMNKEKDKEGNEAHTDSKGGQTHSDMKSASAPAIAI